VTGEARAAARPGVCSMAECTLLPGWNGIFLQAVLGLCSLGMLCVKFHFSHANRTAWAFLWDTMKQLCGAFWLHILNMAFARYLTMINDGRCDECGWYWLQIVMDDTLGVWVSFHILHGLLGLLKHLGMRQMAYEIVRSEQTRPGGSLVEPLVQREEHEPNQPPLPRIYAIQVGAWMIVVTLMKLSMVLFAFAFANPLQVGTGFVFAQLPMLQQPMPKLWAVMIITPLVMNTLQFFLVDNIFLDAHQNEEMHRGVLRHDRAAQQLYAMEQILRSNIKDLRQQLEDVHAELAGKSTELRQRDDQIPELQASIQRLEEEKARRLSQLEAHDAERSQVAELSAALDLEKLDKTRLMQKIEKLQEKEVEYLETIQRYEQRQAVAQGPSRSGFWNRIVYGTDSP